MSKPLRTLLIVAALSSCQPKEYRLKDLVDTEAIDSVTIHNNNGVYRLNPAELRAFRHTLGVMHYLPEASLKMGTIGFDIYLCGQGHYVAARTHGKYVKMHRSLIDRNSHDMFPLFSPVKDDELIFEFDEAVNLDNFHKKP
ncbi:hypothetical protein [Hymenobacter mucosus]|uniref:Lipoprotein n=1 Tax=Hymenobacter mucosus TaxID=1411120 RepID=A0A238V4S2_9BACT|nr:hypothetical protein [Hymenobacter mucosus]SNR28997.1 hypothetical protein SAMN06269173_10179 [Hymenobacter mucosus]